MKNFYLPIFALLCLGIGKGEAQYTDLLNFNDTNGGQPYGDVTIAGNRLFGMTSGGGVNGLGVIFSIDTNGGGYKDLFDFDSANGWNPFGSLTLSGKVLYGMVSEGGADSGCIFSMDTNGVGYKILFDFMGTNGATPRGNLTLSGGKLYGMTSNGGAYKGGIIFSIDTNGNGFTDLFDFNGVNGAHPYGSLILSGNVLYGMTFYGGTHDSGCIFSIDTNGTGYKDLFNFNVTNGGYPVGSLTLLGKVLYGMASEGGLYNWGVIFSIDTNGSRFKNLLNFDDNPNGATPWGSLTPLGNKLYGMAQGGKIGDNGLIFSIDTNGNGFGDLYDFTNLYHGDPLTSLTISGNILYGMVGGVNDAPGNVFGFKDNSLGIDAISANSGTIHLYPNPSNGTFTIVLSHAELVSASQTIIEVYNVLGEQVYSQFSNFNSQISIDLSSQSNGVYLYRVLSETGSLVGEGKIVIQK